MTGSWPLSWATGDVTLASEYRKGIGCLFDSTLGAPAANVEVTSISSAYAHLLVVVYARSDAAFLTGAVQVRFNNDTGANYDYQRLSGLGSITQAAETFATTSMVVAAMPAATAGANLFNAAIAFIPNYAGSSNNKLALAISSFKTGTTTGSIANYLMGGFWRSNAAINRITLFPTLGNFVAGTRVSVHGMGA